MLPALSSFLSPPAMHFSDVYSESPAHNTCSYPSNLDNIGAHVESLHNVEFIEGMEPVNCFFTKKSFEQCNNAWFSFAGFFCLFPPPCVSFLPRRQLSHQLVHLLLMQSVARHLFGQIKGE